MRLRFSLVCAFLATGLAGSPAHAQQSAGSTAANDASALPPTQASRDHLAYYTYYKTLEGETVAGVASKFGLAETSLVRMNPYLSQYGASLPTGTLVCVPKEQSKPTQGLLARSERIASAKAKAEEEARAAAEEQAKSAKSGKGKTRKKASAPKAPAKESDDISAEEWEKLAGLCTKGAPVPPERSSMVIEAPPSMFIGSNGQVTWIPAAKPRVVKPKATVADASKGELTSRRAKAILAMVMTGRSFMGVPYVWGGEDPSGFDCSGFTQYVFAKNGVYIPRTADIQFNVGKVVKRGEERPGDLVFFETYCPGPSHVGIYLGNDWFLHASSSRGVTTERLSCEFFAQRYLGAKRNF